MVEPEVVLSDAQLVRFTQELDPIVVAADSLVVEDATSLQVAADFLTKKAKPLLKRIDESCEPVREAAYAAWKRSVKQQKDLKEPILQAIEIVERKIVTYNEQVEAERQRARKAAEEQLAREEQERRLSEAAQMEERGHHELADEILTADAAPPIEGAITPNIPPAAKASGISIRRPWECEVTDLLKVVKAVAQGKAPLSVLKIDKAKLTQLVRSQDGQIAFGGVRVYRGASVSKRG